MDFNDLYDAGSDILGAVTDAINTGDFGDISETIQRAVDDVTENVRRELYRNTGDPTLDGQRRTSQRGAAAGSSYRTSQRTGSYSAAGTGEGFDVRKAREAGDNPYRRNSPYARQHASFSSRLSPFLQRRISKLSGVGAMIGGGIGIFAGVSTLLFGALPLLFGATGTAIGAFLTGGAITGASAFAFFKGKKKKELVKRYYEYGAVAGDAEYIELKKLARQTGRTVEEVREDIRQMIKEDMLPQAWLDRNETTLMLTEEMYAQYQAAEQSRQERESKAAEEAQSMAADGVSEQVRAILEEGRSYSQTIRECNDVIPDPTMSQKLYDLEHTMNRILDQVRKNPASAGELRKLMSYYLPTTVKLLRAYIELDRQPKVGDNITRTKKEIEDALDTINQAFEQLLDSLFEDLAWDVSTDISVMKTMLQQDGLSKDDLQKELAKERKRRAAAEAMAAQNAEEDRKKAAQAAAEASGTPAAAAESGGKPADKEEAQQMVQPVGGAPAGASGSGKAGSGWDTYDTGYGGYGGGSAYQTAPEEETEQQTGPVLKWDE